MPAALRPPTENTAPAPPRGLRRLHARLPDTRPLRRLGSVADLIALGIGMVVLTLTQLFTGTDTSNPHILSLLAIITFVVVGLHVVRTAPLSGPVDAPHTPAPARQKRRPGRKPGVPTGFDRETAREQARRLRQMRREGTTWEEAARALGLTKDQAMNVYERYDALMADDDGR